MMRYCLALSVLLLTNIHLPVQIKFSTDSDSSPFLTKDIDQFWKAFDALTKDATSYPFGGQYIAMESAGLQKSIQAIKRVVVIFNECR